MPESNVRTEALRRAARELIGYPIPEDEAVDVVGEVAAVIRSLQDFTKSLKSEMVPATGRGYVATTSRSAKRSYNTQGLLAEVSTALADAGGEDTLAGALRFLMDADAVRLTWRWTELQAVVIDLDVPMTIVRHEIEDGDPKALVGEVWTEATSVGAKHAD